MFQLSMSIGNVVLTHVFCLFGATFPCSNASLIQDWEAFVDPRGYFEVLMPDSVSLTSNQISTALGDLEYVSITSEEVFDEEKVQYALNYCDYPAGVFHADSTELIDEFFRETIIGAVEQVEGELIYSDVARDTFYPTRIWKISTAKFEMDIKSKAMLVGDRYYIMQVIYPSSVSVALNRADEFFDSFKVKRK